MNKLLKINTISKKKPKYSQLETFVISCDWCQMHVKARPDFMSVANPFFMVKLVGQSRVFSEIYEIRDIVMNKVIATYCTGARDFIFPKHHGIVKLENFVLYAYDNLEIYVRNFFDRIGFKFKGFTRLDICLDFQEFTNKYSVQNFIRDYMASKFFRNDKRQSKVKTVAVQDCVRGMDFQTLSFGSRKSNINTKLYNKTSELKESGKNHIIRLHDRVFNNDKDVWRLEFSIMSLNAFLKGNNKEKRYNDLSVLNINYLYGIFIGLFDKYFDFRIPKREVSKITGKVLVFKGRTARLKRLKLLNFVYEKESVLIFKRDKPMLKNSSRSTKIFIKKMDIFNHEFRLFDENFDFTARELLGKIIDAHGLEDWANERKIEFNKKNNYIDELCSKVKNDTLKLDAENERLISNCYYKN